jgi:DNA-binding NarL/FixJ family response regulator
MGRDNVVMFTAREQSPGFDLRRLGFILAPVLGLFALEASLHEGFDEHVLPGHVDFVACVAALALVYWFGRAARSRPKGFPAAPRQPRLVAGDDRLVDPPPPEACLTFREIEVLALLGQHLTNREIAGRLTLSEHTVKNHVKNILSKLGVESRREAVALGRQRGWLAGDRTGSRDAGG